MFEGKGYKEQKHLARLKTCNLEQLFPDIKKAHIKRLKMSIAYMREQTDEEKLQEKVKKKMREKTRLDMEDGEPMMKKQHRMWEQLKESCLKAEDDLEVNSSNDNTLKDKLKDLRDSAIKVLSVVNVLWLVFIVTIAKSDVLHISGHNPLGILSLAVFGLIQVFQFLAMVYHRTMAFLHWVARAEMGYENKKCLKDVRDNAVHDTSMNV
ncbi:PREDICTED: uncharacterized protein LOC109471283 [Branchiostoma belcheri]|uniref:Uncharacterized protein LOC109471283 n=1 Tax=Branchiostoma belcheri TaxID=7741 RepID=A0A6P4Z8Y6_BRABE|nr:PREDICTED: uncharacterized protein LOC109471283 [Branchiostoma belcheri]